MDVLSRYKGFDFVGFVSFRFLVGKEATGWEGTLVV